MSKSPFRQSLVTLALFVAALSLMGMFRSATAQPSAAPKTPTRVATVNLAKVMDGLTEAKDAEARLKSMLADSKKKLDDLTADLKKVDADLEMMKDKKDAPEFRKLVGQRFEIVSSLEVRQKILQQLIDEEEGATVRTMYLKMTDAVKRLAVQDSWELVLRDDRDITPPEKVRDNRGVERPITGREVRGIIDQRVIIAASDRIDVTQQVITMMNNEYKGTKP